MSGVEDAVEAEPSAIASATEDTSNTAEALEPEVKEEETVTPGADVTQDAPKEEEMTPEPAEEGQIEEEENAPSDDQEALHDAFSRHLQN